MASVISANENIVSFRTSEALPFSGARIEFSPVQAGSGDPSPDNVREITGWTGIEIARSGKNLVQFQRDSYGPIGSYMNGNSGWYNTSAIKDAVLRNRTITYSAYIDATGVEGNSHSEVKIWTKNMDGSWAHIGVAGNQIDGGSKGWSSVTINTGNRKEIAMGVSLQKGAIISNGMVEVGDTATEFEQYIGGTESASFGQTVYGGWCDPFKGIGEITWVSDIISNFSVALNSNSENAWSNWHINPQASSFLHPKNKYGFPHSECWVMCDSFLAMKQDDLRENEERPIIWMASTSTVLDSIRIKYRADCALTAAEFKEKYGNVRITYAIETPIPFTFTPATLSTLVGVNNFWSNANGPINEVAYRNSSTNIETYRDRIMNSPHVEEASGSIASFQTDMVAPVKEIKIHFNPQQASGTPSPSSPIPIYGWDGFSINKTNKNFLTDKVVYRSANTNYFEYTLENNSITMLKKQAGSCFILIEIIDKITPNMVGLQFVYSASIINPSDIFVSCNSDGSSRSQLSNGVIRQEDVGKVLTLRWYPRNDDTYPHTYSASNMQVELDSATSYAPHVGNQIPVSWSQLGTVYGGYVNEKGEVWATYEKITYIGDYSAASVNVYDTYNRFVLSKSYFTNAPKNNGNALFNYLKSSSTSIAWNGFIGSTGNVLVYMPVDYDTKTKANNYFAENNLEICYELDTPRLVGTISPIQLKTLYNQNNIWSSGNGDIEVDYWTHIPPG